MLALRAQARDTWRRARARDDESLARQRERRILDRVSDRKRGYGARTTGVLIIALGLLAATAAAMIANRHRALEETTSSFREPEAARAPSRVSTSTPSLPAEAPVASSAPEQSMPAAPAQEARHAMTPAVTHGGQADDAEDLWRAAEAAVARGDRTGAEASLRALLQKPRQRLAVFEGRAQAGGAAPCPGRDRRGARASRPARLRRKGPDRERCRLALRAIVRGRARPRGRVGPVPGDRSGTADAGPRVNRESERAARRRRRRDRTRRRDPARGARRRAGGGRRAPEPSCAPRAQGGAGDGGRRRASAGSLSL